MDNDMVKYQGKWIPRADAVKALDRSGGRSKLRKKNKGRYGSLLRYWYLTFGKGDGQFPKKSKVLSDLENHCNLQVVPIENTERIAKLSEALKGRLICLPKIKQKREIQQTTIEKKAVTDAFYDSYEWRKLRYRALVQHGGQCMACGRTRKDGVILHVDHIKPRKKFPELQLTLSNLQVLCHECNHGKSNWDQTDWR
jgi:5-methylcytosine-specific restriction endonuclease McrA